MMLAKYIKYSTDYRYAYGMLKKGGEIRNTPVQIGRRAHHYTRMTEANWRDLMRGNEKEFAINKALTEMGDLRLWGEVNTFRGSAELKKTLEEMLKDAHGRVKEVMRELIKVEIEYKESKKRLELANAYFEINDKFHTIFGLSPCPRRVIRSPDITPITPTLHGPNEMPVLMDEDSRRNRKCYRCRQYGHVVQECPKGSKPRRRKNKRAVRGVEATQVQVVEEKHEEVSPPLNKSELTLLERISLLDRSEWTPEVCSICGKINAKHSALECPLYERCDCCRGTGSYGYRNTHTCYAAKEGYLIEDIGHNECDYDLYWSGKD